ncbi:MAG: RNA polymerase sigma factor [Candidatus Eremiobacteraeota bacterium]|nr:RNA polymerase sigma factor [Candidatus Eremiobacteraeota bacterium]
MADYREKEMTALFNDHYRKVYNLCRRLVGNATTAQDMVQEVFMKAFRNLGSFRGECSLTSWLYSIATNHCLDCLRRERRWYEKIPYLAGAGERQARPLEEEVAHRELGRLILEKISPSHRALLVLKTYLGLNYQEIAAVMNITPGSVGVMLTRARREALKIAEKEGITDEVRGL